MIDNMKMRRFCYLNCPFRKTVFIHVCTLVETSNIIESIGKPTFDSHLKFLKLPSTCPEIITDTTLKAET